VEDEAGRRIKLVHYSAGEVHPSHAHEHSCLSVLLAGEFQESVAKGEFDLARPVVAWKPSGFAHADRFGPSGAMLISIPVPEDSRALIDMPPGWHDLSGFSPVEALLRLGLACKNRALRQDAWADLLSHAGPPARPCSTRLPIWLKHAREMLRDDPEHANLERLSSAVGIHRVHLSRSFTATFGISPSAYRLRSMVARTLSAVVDRRSTLIDAAHHGNFADYSHAARSVKKATGLRMGEIKNLLA
jgi:AraC family transcriptional regulator